MDRKRRSPLRDLKEFNGQAVAVKACVFCGMGWGRVVLVPLDAFFSFSPPPPPHLFFYLLTYFLSLLQPFSPYFPPFVWFVLHALFAVCSVLCLREVTVRRAHGFFLNPWLVLLEPRVLAGSDRSLVTSEERRSVNFN